MNSQRQFSFKFDAAFFPFLFDTLKVLRKTNDEDARQLESLGLHTYACVLNEMSPTNPGPPASLSSNSLSNLNDNLIKAVQPQIVDHIFNLLVTPNDATRSLNYMTLNDNFMWLDKTNEQKGLLKKIINY